MATKTMRTVRRVEKPRPLKSSENLVKVQPVNLEPPEKPSLISDNILENLESLHVSISNGNLNENTSNLIDHVCTQLKDEGSLLELSSKDQLDKYFVTLRNVSRDERLAIHVRIRLLEIIELRAMGWRRNENINSYYENRSVNIQQPSPTYMMRNVGFSNSLMSSLSTSAIPTTVPFVPPNTSLMTSASQATLGPGEIIKNSGKFVKPTKIPGKNFFKDEVVIRNSDSGKVSPGAQDRLVQISGSNEENINHAKVLIEDTIRRNASPIRDIPEPGGFGSLATSGSCNSLNSSSSDESLPNQPVTLPYQPPEYYPQEPPQNPSRPVPLMHSSSMGSSTFGDYSCTVVVGTNIMRISGSDVELVKTAKMVLEQYFAGHTEILKKQLSPDVFSTANPLSNSSNLNRKAMLDVQNGNIVCNGHVRTAIEDKKENYMANLATNWVLDAQKVYTTPVGLNSLARADTTLQVTSPNDLNRRSDNILRHTLIPTKNVEDLIKCNPESAVSDNRLPSVTEYNSFESHSDSLEKSRVRQLSPNSERTNTRRVFNTYGFLLDCAASEACKVFPETLKNVATDVAAIMVKEVPSEYFDPVVYKAVASARKSNTRSNSTGGTEEIR